MCMIPCLYTTQRNKKNKSWHDGYIKQNGSKKLILFDYEQKPISRFNIKELKEEMTVGIYMLQIEDQYLNANNLATFGNSSQKTETNVKKDQNTPMKGPEIVQNSTKTHSVLHAQKKFVSPIDDRPQPMIKRRSMNKVKDIIGINQYEVVKINNDPATNDNSESDDRKKIKKLDKISAGYVLQKRIKNVALCLKEYIKLLNGDTLDYAHKLCIDDLQKEMRNFSEKHYKYKKTLEKKKERSDFKNNIKVEDGDENEVAVGEVLKNLKEVESKYDDMVENKDRESLNDRTNEINKETRKQKGEKSSGRSSNEICDLLDD